MLEIPLIYVKSNNSDEKRCCHFDNLNWYVDNSNHRCTKTSNIINGVSCSKCKIWICNLHRNSYQFCQTCGTKLV